MEKLFFSDPWFPSRRSQPTWPSPSPSPKSKVISIPVTDGSKTITISNKPNRLAAAVKIQKAVRGFLVRKNMRTLQRIATEAEEIGQHISPEKVCSNANERLRIGEMLMALLLRLDAVRGVRDYRKKVIRRVIQLQEAVDGMMEDVENVADDTTIAAAEEFEEEARPREDLMGEEAETDSDETVGEEMKQESNGMPPETMDNRMAEAPPKRELSCAEETTGMKEMMEKSAVENEMLKRLVSELCERSAQQCELMSGLVQRVQQLERRFQGMGRRKKRDKANHSKKQYAM